MNLKKSNLYRLLLSNLIGLISLICPTEQIVNELTLNFQTQTVQTLNLIRDNYKVPDLLILPNLTINAQISAEIIAKNDSALPTFIDLLECGKDYFALLSLAYPETATPQCGQNIAKIEVNVNFNCQPEIIIKSWEAENIFYNYDNPPSDFFSKAFVSQFTQMVWKESQYVGVGVAISESGTHCIVVVRYWPAGNIVGKYTDNVQQPKSNGNESFTNSKMSILLKGFLLLWTLLAWY